MASAAPPHIWLPDLQLPVPTHRGGLRQRWRRAQQPRGLQVAQQPLQQQQAPLRRARRARRAAAGVPAKVPARVQRRVQVSECGVQGARRSALGRRGLHPASGRLLPPRPGRQAASSGGRRLRRRLRSPASSLFQRWAGAACRLLGESASGYCRVHLAGRTCPPSSFPAPRAVRIGAAMVTISHVIGKQRCRLQACRFCTFGRCAAMPTCLPRSARAPEGEGPRRRRRGRPGRPARAPAARTAPPAPRSGPLHTGPARTRRLPACAGLWLLSAASAATDGPLCRPLQSRRCRFRVPRARRLQACVSTCAAPGRHRQTLRRPGVGHCCAWLNGEALSRRQTA